MICLPIILIGILAHGQSVDITFFGIVPGGAPEFEKGFEKLLREQIAVTDGITMADYFDIQYLKKKTNFLNSPYISRSLIQTLLQISNEKALIVWGEITDYSIKTVRRWLIGAEVIGSLTLNLSMYSLAFHEFLYLGDIKCVTNLKKPPVFFRSTEKVTEINVSDRINLLENLQADAVQQSVSIINTLARGIITNAGIIAPANVKTEKVPSVSDLFDIPSVEAEDIDRDAEEKKRFRERRKKEKDDSQKRERRRRRRKTEEEEKKESPEEIKEGEQEKEETIPEEKKEVTDSTKEDSANNSETQQ